MPIDSNRGRDFPRAPQFERKGWPRTGPTGDPREDARRKHRARKKLEEVIAKGGYESLFGNTFVSTNPEKAREKKRKVVLEAMAFRVDEERSIPRELLEEVGLTPEDNPRVPVFDEPEIPF